jgi:transcription elongation GreA/GreB family factor
LSGGVDKAALVRKIIAQLDAELEGYARSARTAHEEATHEQSKAENKYDTRGLEASYLAHGQSRLAAATRQARQDFADLSLYDFAPGEPIELGALVEIERPGGRALYFIGPRAGGMEIVLKKREVLVLTPESPLGQQLIGRKQGDRWPLAIGGERGECRIVSVT